MQQQVPLARHTTFHLGGPAAYYVEAITIEMVKAACNFATEQQLPLIVLGGGSNVLVADAGVAAVILRPLFTTREAEVSGNQVTLTAGAGVELDDLVAFTVEQGWWGIENLSHIPGSVGATPVQNVGAYGVEMSDVITAVEVYDRSTDEVLMFSNEECQFGYRDSRFKHEPDRYIVLRVTLKLSTTPKPRIHYKDVANVFSDSEPTQQAIREAIIRIRSHKFPDWTKEGTAGSFFKNPIVTAAKAIALKEQYSDLPTYPLPDGHEKIALGWIFDKVLGRKGHTEGNVRCFAGQALVLVATAEATATEVAAFAASLRDEVFTATGVVIEPEVRFIGHELSPHIAKE